MWQNTMDKVENPAPACRNYSGWRSQFANPHGWLGWIAGQLMGIRNQARSEWVISLLDLRPESRVLEIGFGSGADIRRVCELVSRGTAAGIDHSETMLRLATRRNRVAIAQGHVELQQGDASRLPYGAGSFDTVFAINVAQFWDRPADTAGEMRRVLKLGGLVALAVQPRSKGANEQTATETGARLTAALTGAGFRDVRLERRPAKPVSTVCGLGVK